MKKKWSSSKALFEVKSVFGDSQYLFPPAAEKQEVIRRIAEMFFVCMGILKIVLKK